MKRSNTKIFEAYYTEDSGVWYFVPNKKDLYKKGKPCYGFGQIKYGEGSVYTGEIYFDGKEYHKQGFGKQEFTYSIMSQIMNETNDRIYLFVGEFNYKKTNWIHGNGTLYYIDKDGKPSRFVKGFFSNLEKIDEYNGDYDYTSLVKGYKKEMESEFYSSKSLIKSEIDMIKDIEEPDTLFIGDSYFEFWYNELFADKTFKECFDTSKYLNIGVGGSKYSDWINWIDEIKDFPKFKNIIINLGFNDLHHSKNDKAQDIYNDFLTFNNKIRTIFPNANYYVLSVCHSKAYKNCYNKEVKYNNLMKKNALENKITIIDNSFAIENKQKEINCYNIDNVHLNPVGYEVMLNLIKDMIKQ